MDYTLHRYNSVKRTNGRGTKIGFNLKISRVYRHHAEASVDSRVANRDVLTVDPALY